MGTHDSNTNRGYWQELAFARQQQVQEYLQQPVDESTVNPALVGLAWSSSTV
jgi:4-alpha-glucanotransferase